MNEGENSGMPNTPVFSSPNTSLNPQPAQPASPAESPSLTPAAIVSSPDDGEPQAAQIISSNNTTPASTRPRFGFSRKFKAKTAEPQRPIQPAFNNAPDYFNQAVADITIANESTIVKKQKTKRIAIIAGSALAVIACVVAAAAIIGQINKPNANKVKTAFNRYANYVLYGEEKDSDIGEYSTSIRYAIMDKYINVDESYNNHFKELFDKFYEEYNAAAENGIYEKGKLDGYRNTVYGVYASFALSELFDEDSLVETVYNKGRDAAVDEIKQSATNYLPIDSSKYLAYWVKAKEALADLADYRIGNGCLDDTGASEGETDCVFNETYGGLSESYSYHESRAIEERTFERKLLYDQLFNMGKVLDAEK